MKTLRTIASCLIAVVLVTANTHSQDINDYVETDGEIVFVLGSLDQNLSENPEITLNLNGPVFRDDADYQLVVENTHDDYSTYGSTYLYGTSMTLIEGTRDIICWESVFEEDESAIADICPGMVGWGEYEVSIVSDENSFSFDLSTLDGEWMKNRGTTPYLDTAAYQMIFYIDFGETEISVKIYDWAIEDWDPVYEGNRITFWENHAGGRKRTTIEAINKDFMISADSRIPKVLTDVTFDIDIMMMGDITIKKDSTIRIIDYHDGHNSQYSPSKWIAHHQSAQMYVYVNGYLVTRSVDPDIRTRNTKAVYFKSNRANHSPDWGRISIVWQGFKSENFAGGKPLLYDLRDTYISRCSGIKADNVRIKMSNCGVDSTGGIYMENTHLEMDSCTLSWCHSPIWFDDETNYLNSPSYINETDIYYSLSSGIKVWPNYAADRDEPEERLIIRNSEIKLSQWHGIYSIAADYAVRNCIISRNGWRWGILPTSDSTGSEGIYASDGKVYIHHNEFDTNTRYGIAGIGGDFWGTAASNQFGDAVATLGQNCFDNNWVNVYAEGTSELEMGSVSTTPTLVQTHNRNVLKNPRYTEPSTQHKLNVHLKKGAFGAAMMNAMSNYWYPSFTESIKLEGGFIDARYPIISSDSVRCGLGDGVVGSGLYENDDERTKDIYKSHLAHSYQNAYDTAKTYISDDLTDRESLVYLKALQYAYLYGNIDSALTVIESEALEAKDPDEDITVLDFHSMIILRKIYFITKDSSGFYALNDSIRARLPISDNPEGDTLLVDLYEAKGALFFQDDVDLADSLITILYGKHPFCYGVQSFYHAVTGDTAIYHVSMSRQGVGHQNIDPVPNDVVLHAAYPNPFNPTTTISYSLPVNMNVVVRVYDINGREIDELISGISPAGTTRLIFDAGGLSSGHYRCVLYTENGAHAQNLVVVK